MSTPALFCSERAIYRIKKVSVIDSGKPRFGLSFLGPAWSEASLIGYAYAYEQRTQTRNKVQPYIVPSTELVDVVGKSNGNASVPMGKRSLGRFGNYESVRRYETKRSVDGKRDFPRMSSPRLER